MPGIDLTTKLLHIVKLNLSWVFFFWFSFPTVSILCWIHWVPVEHVSYILIYSIKTFICVIKIQVSKINGFRRQLASLFGRSCIWGEKKDTEIISLHDWFGSLFANPFLVHHVKLYPKCILFGNRKSFFLLWKNTTKNA